MYPLISDRQWSSVTILLGFSFVGYVLYNFFHNLGQPYPSAGQRGMNKAPEFYPYKNVDPMKFYSGGLQTPSDIELYTKAYADD